MRTHTDCRLLGVEQLEDRLTPNNRFVVPVPIAADNVTTFHTLAAALSTPGLASGNFVQVEPFSTPGTINNANVDAIDTTNVTIRGAAGFAPAELPVVRTADAVSVDAGEVALTFQNLNLQLDHSLTFNFNGTVRGCNIVVGSAGSHGIFLNGTTATYLENNSIVSTGVNTGNAVVRVFPGGGSSNRITGNTIATSGVNAPIGLYYDTTATVSDVVSHNTFLASAVVEPANSGSMLFVSGNINGLTVSTNTFRDSTAVNAAVFSSNARNLRVQDNVFDLTYGASATRAALAITAGGGTSAIVRGNAFTTGAFGRAIDVEGGTATEIDVRIEGNDFRVTPLGVRITATSASAQVGDIDLGGGPLGGLGGNNFRGLRAAATATAGAVVVDGGGNNLSAQAINARFNLFGVADPETVVRDSADNATLANVVATGNPTGNAAFVQSVYGKFLKRVGVVSGATDAGMWVNQMNGGTPSVAVANAIARSPEALGYVVDGLFRDVLGRDADPAGRTHHVNLLAGGMTIEQLQAGLFGGAEYRARFPSDAVYVASLFNTILGRSPQGGQTYWVNQLPSLGRNGVAAGFLNSTEYRQRLVRGLFADLLKRGPTQAEVDGWVNTGLDLLSLRVSFAGSVEFFQFG